MRDYRDIVIVLDRSGSMDICQEAMEESLNGYLNNLKSDSKETRVSLYSFDDTVETVFLATPLSEVPNIKINPRGGTALLDAMAFAVDETGRRLGAMPEDMRPNEVLVVVITDGQENVSREYARRNDGYARVSAKVTHQRDKYSWTFVYLGANQDAIAVASSIGVAAGNALNYSTSQRGTKKMSDALTIGTYSNSVKMRSLAREEKTSGGVLNFFDGNNDVRDETEEAADDKTKAPPTYQNMTPPPSRFAGMSK